MAPRKKEEYFCLQCKLKVAENQFSVACSICDRWIHKDCGLDEDEYKLVDKMFQKKGFHCWSCDGCAKGLSKLHKMIVSNQREIASLREDVTEIQVTTDKNVNDIVTNAEGIDSLRKDVEELKSTENSGFNNEGVLEELDLRESKKANLMIFSIPEPDETLEPLLKKKADIQTMKDICASIDVNLNSESDIKFIYRVGELGEKSRPLSLGFRNAGVRDRILKNAWKLNKSDEYKKISLAPDLTPLQLKKEKKLLAEAEEKNKELSDTDAKNYVWKLIGIRGNRILRKVKRTAQGTQKKTRTASVRRTRAEMEEGEVEEEEGAAVEAPQANKRRC
jgi:hypothetical protein